MTAIPSITIITRHSAACDHRDDPFYKRCACRRSLRFMDPVTKKMTWKKTGQRSWAGAERFKRDFEANYGTPVIEAKAMTVRSAVAAFLFQKQGQNLSTAVILRHTRELGRLTAFCERNHLHTVPQMRLHHLSQFRATWPNDYPASSTRAQVQGRLCEFFDYCLHADLITKNTAAGLSSIKVDQEPTLPLTKEQYAKLLETIPVVYSRRSTQQRVRGLLQCMRHTGLAIGDAVGLPRTAIIETAAKVTCVHTSRQKTGVDVYVPIPPEVTQEIAAVPNHNPEYFFWNTGKGTLVTAVCNWQKSLRPLFRKAGLPNGHPHQLRDTFAVEMLSAGIPIGEVSKMLGHSNIATTEKHYAPWVKLRQERLTALVVATWNVGEVQG
jgi:integrase/recombinase XerD